MHVLTYWIIVFKCQLTIYHHKLIGYIIVLEIAIGKQ